MRALKCMSKRTKPDWVHTSLELCKRKIIKNVSLGAQRAPLFINVKWKGYPIEEASWEPEEVFSDDGDLLSLYKDHHQL